MKVKDEEKNIKKVETQNKIVKTKHENTDNLAESKEEIKKDVKIETKQKGLEKDVETEAKQKEIKKDAKIEKKQEDPEKNVETEKKQKELKKDAKKEQEKKEKENTTEFKPIENTEEAKTNKSDVLVIFGILLAIVILLVTVVYGTFSIMTEKSTTIAKGVYIKNIDVSGLTREQAKEKLESIYSEKKKKDITLKYEDFETTIAPETLETNYNIEKATNEAILVGKSGNIITNNYGIFFALIGKKNIKVETTINEEQTKQAIEDIQTNLPETIEEPDYYIENDKLIITPGKEGLKILTDKLLTEIKEQQKNINTNQETIEIPAEKAWPSKVDIDKIHQDIYKKVQDAYITKDPVDTYVPLYVRDGQINTQYIMTTLEELGLLKMDFLGLRNLTVIQNTIDMVKVNHGIDVEFDHDMSDPKVYKLWQDGNTSGIFQFESQGMTNFMKELKPDCLEDLIAGVSLYRPGPMDQIPRYIRGKQNPGHNEYTHPSLEPILNVTYGCMVYQEQVMQIVRDLAGYSLGRADLVRRAMGKKKLDVMAKEREVFIHGQVDEDGNVVVPGCVRNGIDEVSANKIFDEKLSVRETEKLVKEIKNPKKPKEKKVMENAFIYQDLEEKMKGVFGTKVSIASKGKGKGKIEIEYYSDDELEHLFDMMMSIKRGE